MTTKFIALNEHTGECGVGDTLEEAFEGLDAAAGTYMADISFFEATPVEVEFKLEKKESK